MVGDPLLADIRTLRVECADCGRERWWKRAQIMRQHIPLTTPLSNLAPRFRCSDCRDQGLPGTNVCVTPDLYDHAEYASSRAIPLAG